MPTAVIDIARTEDRAIRWQRDHRSGVIVHGVDGVNAIADAILVSQSQERRDTYRRLERIESQSLDNTARLQAMERTITGDNNGNPGLIRKLDRIAIYMRIIALVASAILVSIIGVGVARLFGS